MTSRRHTGWKFDRSHRFDAGPYEVVHRSGETYLVWPGYEVRLTLANARRFGIEPTFEEEPDAHVRPSWDDYFLGQLDALAARATCDRGRSAAIFVRDNDQLAAGYVGSPPGFPHCDDVGHLWSDADADVSFDRARHCVRTLHAEQNAVIRAVRNGISLRDTTVYCTMEPCFNCAMTMIGIGVYRVVAKNPYHAAQRTREAFESAGVILVVRSTEELYAP